MARQLSASVDNTFVKGLITEATGLNFPEHACTDADNSIFSILGSVERRPGLNFEPNFVYNSNLDRNGRAVSSYLWNNASGDGLTQIYVCQIGATLTFYLSSSASLGSPLSTTRLSTTINLSNYLPAGSVADTSISECQYADGNGYLFIFHKNLTPVYCTYTGGTLSAVPVTVQVRDFTGIVENTPISNRPSTLTAGHQYNLNNQGWTQGSPWAGTDSTTFHTVVVGSHSFTIAASLPITNGDNVQVFGNVSTYGYAQNPAVPVMTGSVTSYSGTTLVLNVYSVLSGVASQLGALGPITLSPTNTGYTNTWLSAVGNYPSNSDIWWLYKNTSNVFSPATTIANVTINSGYAPKGHYILNAFNQQRSLLSGIAGLTDVSTTINPKTGCWFQGRVWYSGIDASFAATGTSGTYSWSEDIYFSQIIQNPSQFGYCYQSNDPTSQNASDLLPSDGGIIRIQGCGSIYKLFPVQNGLLVFASNGVWFITGSTGIGFTANDYTITKISNVRNISSTSFVNVLGYPLFWNEEGIYSVTPSQQGGMAVDNLCLGTILSLYSDIPTVSKTWVRGDYNPLTYIVSWVFRSTNEFSSDLGSRYEYDRVLNFNTATKAFYTDTVGSVNGVVYIHDIKYVIGLGNGVSSESTFKYLTSASRVNFTFSEFNDNINWVDFKSYNSSGTNYISTFTTGYKLKGGALRRWEPMYVYVYTNTPSAYKVQGVWDYAITSLGGRYSAKQTFYNYDANASVSYRRHKIRGHGRSLQLSYSSIDGQPYSIIGWAMLETSNASV